MKISYKDLLEGCLVASIAHAIMTNKYPDLAFEQSWDGSNYSIQNGCGITGTITFGDKYCIGAFRDESQQVICDTALLDKVLSKFPSEAAALARKGTLEYLLLDLCGKVSPAISNIFCCDDKLLYVDNDIKCDILPFKSLQSKDFGIKYWPKYYDMDSKSIELLLELVEQRLISFSKKIVLLPEQITSIPGGCINSECIESFAELNIFI